VPCIRGRWEDGGGRGWVGGLALPIDTANQVACPAGQTDGHSSP